MRPSIASLIAVAVAPIAVSAAPFRRSIDNGTATALVFAQLLEQLEANFYQQALTKFQPSDFTNAGFTSASIPAQELTAIASDEATHVTTLGAALTAFGLQPLSCSLDFSSALTSVSVMLPIARVVEYTGVSAYLGATQLIQDPTVLAAAASIMTNEARHQSVLNLMSGASPLPQAFDIPFLPNEVLAIAGAFFSGPCNTGITPNTALSVTNTGNVTIGTQLQFSSPALNSSTDTTNFSCQMLIGGQPTSTSQPIGNCIVPQGINGPVAIWITPDNQPLLNNLQDRQTQTVVAGPTVLFVDTVGDTLGQLVNNSTGAGAPPPTTLTLSPAQASSLLPSSSSLPISSPTPDPNNASNSNGTSTGTGIIVNGISLVPRPTPSS
jgi:hypothetical protein